MKQMTLHRQSRRSRQRGAILITSLIMLLVLTLISISGMNLSFLENLMATNTQFQTTSLADAEVALRAGEEDVLAMVIDGSTLDFNAAGDQYYLTGTIDPSQHTWSFFSEPAANDSSYVIEYLGLMPLPGESAEIAGGVAGAFVYLFLVDAQSVSSKGATRNVQTVYVTATAP